MDVDQGARWPTADHQPLSPPPELRVGGKRRRLNEGDDEDARELAELLLLDEEEVGDHDPAPRLSAASAHPTSVLAVYAHNAQRFNCTFFRPAAPAARPSPRGWLRQDMRKRAPASRAFLRLRLRQQQGS
eukprot:jgi/Phyca11/17197/fgenesh1_pg.PHYCAscaffold_25_\